MKRILLVLLMLAVTACGHNPAGPSEPITSAGGTLESWMFAFPGGHLVRPSFGTYPIYAGQEISSNPIFLQHMREMIAGVNGLTGGRMLFVLTDDPNAPITIHINPSDPLLDGNTNLGAGSLVISPDFRSTTMRSVIRNEHEFMSNVPLHELGHFLFGPGHSTDPSDIMNPNRSDFQRPSFSSHEQNLWNKSLAFSPGTTP